MAWKAGRIYSNCHSVRVYPRKSCFSGEDWVSIWNQQINPRQVSERASLIGSSYWALNHDKMLLLFPCKLAGNIWYFLHKSSIAVQEIYCSSYQNDDRLSVPIITCHWTWQEDVCMHGCIYNCQGVPCFGWGKQKCHIVFAASHAIIAAHSSTDKFFKLLISSSDSLRYRNKPGFSKLFLSFLKREV